MRLTMSELFRKILTKDRLPDKFGMYICHVRIKSKKTGLIYNPVSYVQFDTITLEHWRCAVIEKQKYNERTKYE